MTRPPGPDLWVDFHNHVIPGVDDGAGNVEEARAALAAFGREGVDVVVASPHLNASVALRPDELKRRMGELDAGWARLREGLPEEWALRVERGAEVMLDVPRPDLSDPRFRLAGSRSVLVEFAYMRVPPRSAETLEELRQAGYLPVLAHPERYQGMDPNLRVVGQWLAAGAFLQVNVGSLLGRYGRGPQRAARTLLERGWVHCLASDYHAIGEPRVAEVRSLLESWGGAGQAARLFQENPSRLLRSEPCLAVDPVAPPGGWLARLRTHLAR